MADETRGSAGTDRRAENEQAHIQDATADARGVPTGIANPGHDEALSLLSLAWQFYRTASYYLSQVICSLPFMLSFFAVGVNNRGSWGLSDAEESDEAALVAEDAPSPVPDVVLSDDLAPLIHECMERKEMRTVALTCKLWKEAAAARIREDPLIVTIKPVYDDEMKTDSTDTWLFSPKSNTWRKTSGIPLDFARKSYSRNRWRHVVKLDGFVYVLSKGQDAMHMIRFDTIDEHWREVPAAFPDWVSRDSMTVAVAFGGHIYTVFDHSDQVASFNPLTQTWRRLPIGLPFDGPLDHCVLCDAVACGSYVYLVCDGQDEDYPARLLRWMPGTSILENVPIPQRPRWEFWEVKFLEANGRLFALGMRQALVDAFQTESASEVYSPDTVEWRVVTHLPLERQCFSAVSVGRKIYVMGGINPENEEFIERVDVFDTETEQWSEVSNTPDHGKTWFDTF